MQGGLAFGQGLGREKRKKKLQHDRRIQYFAFLLSFALGVVRVCCPSAGRGEGVPVTERLGYNGNGSKDTYNLPAAARGDSDLLAGLHPSISLSHRSPQSVDARAGSCVSDAMAFLLSSSLLSSPRFACLTAAARLLVGYAGVL